MILYLSSKILKELFNDRNQVQNNSRHCVRCSRFRSKSIEYMSKVVSG